MADGQQGSAWAQTKASEHELTIVAGEVVWPIRTFDGEAVRARSAFTLFVEMCSAHRHGYPQLLWDISGSVSKAGRADPS